MEKETAVFGYCFRYTDMAFLHYRSSTLFIPPQTSTIASHLPKALEAAISIIRAKELNITRKLADDAVIICLFGDVSFEWF